MGIRCTRYRRRWWFATRMWNLMNTVGMLEIRVQPGEVAQKRTLGVDDMNGLVNEWCSDHWAKTYEGGGPTSACSEGSNHYVAGRCLVHRKRFNRNCSRSFAAEDKISDGLASDLLGLHLMNNRWPIRCFSIQRSAIITMVLRRDQQRLMVWCFTGPTFQRSLRGSSTSGRCWIETT